MSGVLHPAGPEPAQTYWLRRVLVLLSLLVLVLVCVGVAGASMGATRQQSQPPAAAPSDPATSESASAAPSPSASASPKSSASPSLSASSSSSSKAQGATVLPACDRKELKTTLTGKQMLKLSQPAAFTVTVANDADAACKLSLIRTDFELKITSGKKTIWSSRSCSTATFVVAGKLELDQSMSWSMLWDGRATAAGCAAPGAALKRGTYLASATVAGSKVAELPITLRD